MQDSCGSMTINIFTPTLTCETSYETKDITIGDCQESVSIYSSESEAPEITPYDSIVKWF